MVKHGAKVDVCDQRGGITPLHDAVSFGSKEVVMALLEAGARAGRKMNDQRSSDEIPHDATTSYCDRLKWTDHGLLVLQKKSSQTLISIIPGSLEYV